MRYLSAKCPLCSKAPDCSADFFGGYIYSCKSCDFAWIEETKQNLKPAPQVESNENVWKHSKTKLFESGLGLLEKLLPQKGKLLDIGTGFGYFLHMARERGWEASGIEIEQKAIDFAKKQYGLDIYSKPISELDIPDNTYDAVTLWIVIEQLPDPVAELGQIFRILKPGGIVYIRAYNYSFHRLVAKVGGFMSFIFKIRPVIVHSYNFTPKSLRKVIEGRGFKDINITNSPASSGDPYSTGGLLGAGFVSASKFLVYAISQAIALLTAGRSLFASTLIAYARKPK